MRILQLLLTLFLTQCIFSQNPNNTLESIEQCDFKLENITPITDGQVGYREAILSPDAKKILLFGKENTQIMDIKTKTIIRNIEYYYQGQWISNSAIMFRKSNEFIVYKLNLDMERVTLPIPELRYEERHMLKARGNNREWIIADIKGNKNLVCYGFLFSNDFKNVVIYTNSGEDYIYKIDGSGLVSEHNVGLSSDWSSDDKSIISFLGLDFGEDYTVESDLYIESVETDKVCKLTDTKEILETWPSWSQDKISYIDEKSEIVYIADIVKK